MPRLLFLCLALLCWLPLLATAQVPGTPLPLLTQSSLQYVGAFRLPRTAIPSDSPKPIYWSYSAGPLAYHPERGTLYVVQRDGYIAELNIPPPVNSATMAQLPTPTYAQPASDPSSGTWSRLGVGGAAITNGAIIGGILPQGDTMVVSATPYYASGSAQVVSHATASAVWTLQGKQWSGWQRVGPPGHGGFLGGWMLSVPADWRAALGGPALTGQGAIPIISRTSYGPALSVFEPTQLGTMTPLPVLPLLEYSGTHTTLGGYGDTPSLPFNRTASLSGAIFPPGTRTILFFGAIGIGLTGEGDTCYGLPTNDMTRHNQLVNNERYCYDLANGDKGPHGWPYITQVLAYDANELAEVKLGQRQPWDVVPYETWELHFPLPRPEAKLAGVSYDPVHQRLFVGQHSGDSASPPQPLIHVFQVLIPSTCP
jgi:hypothetical protein